MPKELKTRQIYLKDASFQAPSGAAAFSQDWSPQIKVDLSVEAERLEGALYDVSLRVSVICRTGSNTHYMIEVVQGGVFHVSGYEETELHRLLRTICADKIYPYASEAIDGLVVKARFPALLLDPVDFAANYASG